MKRLLITLAIVAVIPAYLQAQTSVTHEPIKEDQVPKVVRDAYENSIGFPVDKWEKLTTSNGPRYVAAVKQMNQSSGKTLPHRYRYNETGKMTSSSEYRGTGKGEMKDFFVLYLGTDEVPPAFRSKITKLLQDNTLISFEGFTFAPGNQDTYMTAHRFVLKDKSSKTKVVFFDADGNEVDMSKYPLRRAEAEEMD